MDAWVGFHVDAWDYSSFLALFVAAAAGEGAAHGVRANVICPGFVRTPLVDKQIPEQAKELGISEQEVIKNVMLKETVDGEFTTVEDVAETALFLASIRSNALTGQSIVVSHGWFMQ
jgi:3-hydroxybutyrate dehydrogenase